MDKVAHHLSLHKYLNTTRSTYGGATMMRPRAPNPPTLSPLGDDNFCAQQMSRTPVAGI